MGISLPHILILLVIVLLIFGAGRLPNVMGDFAKGIKAFKKGMREEELDAQPAPVVKPLEQQATSADPLHRP